MEQINYQIITDPDQTHQLWEQFSSNELLFDTWEFRNCFYKLDNFPLYFIVGYDQGAPIGLLGLQRNTEHNYLEFFGGSWMEDNKVLVKPGYEAAIPDFYAQIKEPAHLIAINSPDAYTQSLPLDDYKFQLDLTNYKTYWDFIEDKFNKKGQDTFRRKIKKIETNKIEVIENNNPDIEKLIEFNIKTFGDDSSFNNEKRKIVYRDFLNLSFEKYLMTIKVNGVVQSVSLNLKHNGIMYYLNAGSNNEEIPNLGSYTLLTDIQKSIDTGCRIFDALMISYNWKERWHFNMVPYHKFNYNYQ
jgi:hypothetical protein